MYEGVESKTILSCAKSAIQKHVRRGEPVGAGCAARIMDGVSHDSLVKRLYIVIVEDSAYCLGFVPKVETDPVGVVMNLADRPMSKDFLHLISLNKTLPKTGDFPDLINAIKAKNMWDASQIMCRLFSSDSKSFLRIFFKKMFSDEPKELEGLCDRPDIAKPLIKRLWQGTFWGDDSTLLICGICAALCGHVETPEWKEFPEDFLEQSFPRYRFPWYSLDIHTPVGRLAMGVLGKQVTLPKNIVTLMFWGMSAKFGRCDHRLWSLEKCLKEEGEDLNELTKNWATFEGKYKELIIWASNKILGEPPSSGGK